MQQVEESPQLGGALATCTPCTLGIHSCCTAHRGACRCDVDRHVAPVDQASTP